MARFIRLPHWKDYITLAFFFALPGLIYWNVFANNVLMFATDGMISFAPKIFVFNQVRLVEIPLWNGYLSIGTPIYADPQTSFFYPFHILSLVFPPTLYTNLYYVIHLSLGGIFAYLFLKEVSGKRWVGLIGGLFLMISICMGGLRKEHPSVYTSIVWLPLILYFIQSFLNIGDKKRLIYSSLAMMMQFLGGTPQWNIYSIILVFIYFIVGLSEKQIGLGEKLKLLALWGGSYLAYSCILLIPAIELILHSSRGASAYFCTYSTTWELYLMTLFPYIFGQNIIHPLGIRSAEISIDIYLGIIPLIYAMYAIRYHFRDRFVKFSSYALVVTLLYSSGCNVPFFHSIFQKIPLLNLFGIQSRVLFIFTFLVVCCAAIGMNDLLDGGKILQLFRFNVWNSFVIILIALAISSISTSPLLGENAREYYRFSSDVYRHTIEIIVINTLITGILYLINNKHIPSAYLHNKAALIILTIIALIDVGQFSTKYIKADFDTLVNTQEIDMLKSIRDISTSRVVTVYSGVHEEYYYKSGLLDNWSMINQIRNLKGFIEFENPSLNRILAQPDSRYGKNTLALLDENSIFSMLSVRYILMPSHLPPPQSSGYSPMNMITAKMRQISVQGNGELSISAIPIKIENETDYLIEFSVETTGKEADPFPADVDLFYVDLYGGSEYDSTEQESNIILDNGARNYTITLSSGNKPLPRDIYLRFVAISNIPLKITNIKMFTSHDHPFYKKIAGTKNYTIYENLNAQELLYIPEQIVGVSTENNILEYLDKYPEMDKISYVTGGNNSLINGKVKILSISNNTVTAQVSSAKGTFVNHSQAFYPGWNAYIDGNKTTIYLVNGVIQGVEVPPGNHLLEFKFEPLSLAIGATLAGMALIITAIYIFSYSRNKLKRPDYGPAKED